MKFFDLSFEFQTFKETYKDLFDYRHCRYDIKTPQYAKIVDAFDSTLLSSSFLRPQVVIYSEYISADYLLEIQKQIETQACNAENICLVTNHTMGCSDWWESYKKICGIKSYKIIEAPWSWVGHSYYISQTPIEQMTPKFWKTNRNINRLFCFYGGSKSGHPQRQYLVFKLLDFVNQGIVDFVGKFDAQDAIERYVENATCFVNQPEVEHILDLYDQYVDSESKLNLPLSLPSDSSNTEWSGFRWPGQVIHMYPELPNEITESVMIQAVPVLESLLKKDQDQQLNTWTTSKYCLAHVVRETRGWDQFCTVTEKTLQTFLHHMLYLPTSGVNNSDYITQLGFKLAPGLFDYDYTKEFHYASRIQKLCNQLEQVKHLTPDDLTQYYLENFDYFQYNFEYIVSQQLFLNIQKRLKEDFERFLFKDTTC